MELTHLHRNISKDSLGASPEGEGDGSSKGDGSLSLLGSSKGDGSLSLLKVAKGTVLFPYCCFLIIVLFKQ